MDLKRDIQNYLGKFAFAALATGFLLLPLFYNGCPLFYPDSLGYIFWGEMMQPVPERVSTYSLVIKALAISRDLWFVIIAQAILSMLVLKEIWTQILGRKLDSVFLLVLFLLGLLSPLGWTVSTLMPDLFCVMSSLILFLILYSWKEGSRLRAVLLFIGFVFCSAQHLGNLMINSILLGICALIFVFNGQLKSRIISLLFAFLALTCSVCLIGGIHFGLSGSFFISKSGPAFLTGRLLETGIASRFLDQNPNQFPEINRFRNQMPMGAEYFLWNQLSPLNQLGGLHDASGHLAEFNKEVLSRPKYLFLFAKAGLKSASKQLLLLDIGDGLLPAGGAGQLAYYPENQAEYRMSKQQGGIDFGKLNIACLVFLTCLFTFCFFSGSFLEIEPSLKILGIFILMLLLVNALVNGALSTPLNRYQVRVFWLVNFWLLASAYPVLQRFFKSKPTSKQ
jgi:hypothetical protein